MFRLGYNTNGLAHHRLLDAFTLLAELGYEGVALTPDVGELDLYAPPPREHVRELRRAAEHLGLDLVVETGARFVLDPRRKHRPSLLEDSAADRERRVDFYRRSIDLAEQLGAGIVSIWSGSAPEASDAAPRSLHATSAPGSTSTGSSGGSSGHARAVSAGDDPRVDRGWAEPLWDRLAAALLPVLDHARDHGVRVGFEPEPGMFVERPSGYGELVRRLGERGTELGLTLDVGHLLVTGDLPIGQVLRTWAPRTIHVHLDDIRGRVHEHRPFGEGDLDLAEALTALRDVNYGGMAAVELSRDSHRGAAMAAEAMRRLRAAGGAGRRSTT